MKPSPKNPTMLLRYSKLLCLFYCLLLSFLSELLCTLGAFTCFVLLRCLLCSLEGISPLALLIRFIFVRSGATLVCWVWGVKQASKQAPLWFARQSALDKGVALSQLWWLIFQLPFNRLILSGLLGPSLGAKQHFACNATAGVPGAAFEQPGDSALASLFVCDSFLEV